MKILEPSYYRKFSCIGDKCKRNCCSVNWNIVIDKKTYELYQNAQNITPELKEIFENNIIENDDGTYKIKQDATSAEIKAKNSIGEDVMVPLADTVYQTKCPFIEESGLCKIHSEMGHEALSTICREYPKSTYQLNEVIHKSYGNSCEVIVKEFIENLQPINFQTHNDMTDILGTKRIDYTKKFKKSVANRYDKIQKLCFDILQTRSISFDNRMILLGEFIFAINDLVSQEKMLEVDKIVDGFAENVDKYITLFTLDVKNHDLVCNLFMINNQNIKQIIDTVESSRNYSKYVLKINEIREAKDFTKFQEFALNRDVLLANYEHLFENLFLNHIYANSRPFETIINNKHANLFDDYKKIAWSYCNYKILIASCLAEQKEVDFDELVDITVQYFRKIEHTKSYLTDTLNALESAGFNKVLHFALLVKSS
ncbi:MAG: flagellin lysine-N-methylase [Clostridia bacterium]